MTAIAADSAQLRTLPFAGRATATARNLQPAAPLDSSEETRQGMSAVAATATSAGISTEAALIARAQAGDHAAFEAIFTQYQTAIYNYIYRLMGSAEDAYDMTQDTFLKAYLALPKTSDDLRVGAWLYRIATNVCLDELRHRKLVKWQPWEAFVSVFHPSQVAKDSPERDCINSENNEEVQLILEKMHPKYRMCLILREYHDLSYDEIAEVLSTTRAAVKSLLFRAREEFRQVYAKVERQPGRAQEA
jgi:RNA polymerase sigma-70 factor (ECF subfamily)